MVAILSITPYFLESSPKGQIHRLLIDMSASDQFDRFTLNNVIPSLRVLLAIYTDCGFFRFQVYKVIRLGSVLVTEGVPSSDRLSNTFSVYAFLIMKPRNDSPSVLPEE